MALVESLFNILSFLQILLILISDISTSENYGKLERVLMRELNLDKSPMNKSLWNNDGYQESTAAHISRNLNGAKMNLSAHFFIGTSMARLHTILPEFNGRYLFINFSTMIGKSVPTTKSPTLATTTTRPSTSTTTTKTTTTTTSTTTTSTTTVAVPATPAPHLPSSSVSAIQLEGLLPKQKETSQVIEIALENVNPPQIQTMGQKRKRRELNSQEISQVQQIISKVANKNEESLHKETIAEPETIASPVEVISPLAVEPVPVPVAGAQKTLVTPAEVAPIILDPQLQYQTWKASLSQSFRPSGFYVMVDDLVIYDNWEGVWVLQKPNVLGKHVKNSLSDLWSHTEILLEWEEPPRKDIKIRFEWDPPTPSSYLFLGNITVSAMVPESAEEQARASISETVTNNKNITLYIVVRQPETPVAVTESQQGKTTSSPLKVPLTTQSTTKMPLVTPILPNPNLAIVDSNTSASNKSTANVLPKVVNVATSAEAEGNAKGNSNPTVSFIIACVLGCVCLFIMIVLMHIKFKENQRLRGNYC